MKIEEFRDGKYLISDSQLGVTANPGVTARDTKIADDKTVYSVEYKFDKYGRRVVPYNNKGAKYFAVFLGGSNLFGEGVAANETIAYHFTSRIKDYRPYVYAFRGHGPGHALVHLELKPLREQVQERDGMVFYYYFSFHRQRLLGNAEHTTWSHGDAPSYVLKNNQLHFTGTFKESRPVYFMLMKALGLLKKLGIKEVDFPSSYSDYAHELTCAAFRKMQQLVKEKLSNQSQFVVVMAPETQHDDLLISNCLEPNNIAHMDLRGKRPGSYLDYIIMPGVEVHQNEKANRFAAEQMRAWVQSQRLSLNK